MKTTALRPFRANAPAIVPNKLWADLFAVLTSSRPVLNQIQRDILIDQVPEGQGVSGELHL